jgi:hypothetical protein
MAKPAPPVPMAPAGRRQQMATIVRSAAAELRVLRRATDRTGALVLMAKHEPSLFQIVRRNLDGDPIAGKGLDPIFLHSAGGVRDQLMAVIEANPKAGVGQYFENQTFELQKLFF